ncbi:MAG: H-NS histone family protein [Magnetococcus sp. DMHC-6]
MHHTDLLAHMDTAVPLAKQAPEAGRLLETDDISQLFGLDMAEGSVELEVPRPVAKNVKPTPAKTSAKIPSKTPAKTLAQVPERKPAVEKPKRVTVQKRSSAMDKPTPAKEPERIPVIRAEREKSVRKKIDTRIPVSNEAQDASNNQKPLLAQSVGIKAIETLVPDRKGEQSRSNQSAGGPFKYQDPINPEQTWSGRGRRPKWVLDHLQAGGDMEELEVR